MNIPRIGGGNHDYGDGGAHSTEPTAATPTLRGSSLASTDRRDRASISASRVRTSFGVRVTAAAVPLQRSELMAGPTAPVECGRFA